MITNNDLEILILLDTSTRQKAEQQLSHAAEVDFVC